MGTINTIADLQKVFGDKPLNSIQPVLTPKPKYPNGKVVLIIGVSTLSLIGLYTIFSKIKNRMDSVSERNSL